MKQKTSASIEVLKNETHELLSWVETKKRGFIGREIENLRKILQTSLERESFEERLEHIKKDVRRWISDWWSPSMIGRKYERYHKNTLRAEVILRFPQLLTHYLDTLSKVDQYSLDAGEEELIEEMNERISQSIETLDPKKQDEDIQDPETPRKRSRRTKPPRCDK